MRIPTKPATHSDVKAATHSKAKVATLPERSGEQGSWLIEVAALRPATACYRAVGAGGLMANSVAGGESAQMT
jgi:hypothetical protein